MPVGRRASARRPSLPDPRRTVTTAVAHVAGEVRGGEGDPVRARAERHLQGERPVVARPWRVADVPFASFRATTVDRPWVLPVIVTVAPLTVAPFFGDGDRDLRLRRVEDVGDRRATARSRPPGPTSVAVTSLRPFSRGSVVHHEGRASRRPGRRGRRPAPGRAGRRRRGRRSRSRPTTSRGTVPAIVTVGCSCTGSPGATSVGAGGIGTRLSLGTGVARTVSVIPPSARPDRRHDPGQDAA